jgi:hypothetical protein
MARKYHGESIAALLSASLLACIMQHPAMGQLAPAQQPLTSNGSQQHKPVPLAHLYWHFLVHQNHLEAKAASEEAQGRDGKWLRNHHQASLGFSDADYAAIRTSSTRLTAEVEALDKQAAAIRAAGQSASSSAQLKILAAQREAYINAEITYLKQALAPDKIQAFETYITQFFSPKNLVIQTSPSTGQPASAAVQP